VAELINNNGYTDGDYREQNFYDTADVQDMAEKGDRNFDDRHSTPLCSRNPFLDEHGRLIKDPANIASSRPDKRAKDSERTKASE